MTTPRKRTTKPASSSPDDPTVGDFSVAEMERRLAEHYAAEAALEAQREPIRPVVSSDRYLDEPEPRSRRGSAVPFMFAVMCIVIGYLLYDKISGPSVVPQPTPVVVPVNTLLAAYVEPIRSKLANDPGRATIVYTDEEGNGLTKAQSVSKVCYSFGWAMQSRSGVRVTDSRVFRDASLAYLGDCDAEGGTQVGEEIENAISGYLGLVKSTDSKEPGYDFVVFTDAHRQKIVELMFAIADAAKEIR